MNDYVLGLDLGITSVGWGIITIDGKIVDSGVRLFLEADAEKNLDRRTHRGSRRLKRRKTQRITEMKRLLIRNNLIFKDFKYLNNPYELRVKGLTSKLSSDELATVLLNIVKRRGSSFQFEITDNLSKDDKSTKNILSENSKLTNEHYVCEVQLKRLRDTGKVRGINNIFTTADYVKEVKQILTNQNIDENIKEKIVKLIERKRHYSDGPGSITSPTPYGKFRYNEKGEIVEVNLIEEMRGKCSIYNEELRAPLSSFSALKFNLLNDLNNLRIDNGNSIISVEDKSKIIDIIKLKGYLSPKTNQLKAIAKVLDISPDSITGYRENKSKKPIFTDFKEYEKLLKVFIKHNSQIFSDEKLIDKITEILTSYKQIDERILELNKLSIPKQILTDIAELSGFSKYHSLSLKAIYILNEELLVTNKNQMQIITEMGLNKTKNIKSLMFDDTLILSPVAKRTHREALKVVTALIKEYGDFSKIVIETTRDKNTKEQKENIKSYQKYREKNNQDAKELLISDKETSIKLSSTQINKSIFYKQQNGKCIYSGNSLDISKIANKTDDYEIDHIIPYSISLDNSNNNKVLVERKANQLKSNLSPFQYFSSGKAYGKIQDFDTFKEIVISNKNLPKKKKELLLNISDIDKYSNREDFAARNLIDTSYAVRAFMTTLKDYFKSNEIPTKVFTIKGKNTSLYRNLGAYQYYKTHSNVTENPLIKNRDFYRHHAIDALIIARLSEQKLFKSMLKMQSSEMIDEETGEISYNNPMEDPNLIKFLKNLALLRDEEIKFSWKVDKKANRRLSNETIYSTRIVDGEEKAVTKSKNIYDLNKETLEKRLIKDKKNLLVYKNDVETYEILLKAYEQYKHEKYPLKSFEKDHGKIRKYSKNNNGPIVTYLKYTKKLGNYLDITNKYSNANRRVVLLKSPAIRIDVYQEPNGHYRFITIRFVDLFPIRNSYVIDEKEYKCKLKEKKISNKAEFRFSLYKNEIFTIKTKNFSSKKYRFSGINDDSKNSVYIKYNESICSGQPSITVGKKIIDIQKYNVSITGKYYKVEKEVLKMRL